MKMNKEKKLTIFICSNYYLEFKKVIEQEGFDDVIIKPFACMCEDKKKIASNNKLLLKNEKKDQSNIIISSRCCEINKLIPENGSFKRVVSEFCFSHFASDRCINQIIDKKGYIIGLNWLTHWQKHLVTMGFDQETARLFFGEFASQLVFFNADIEPAAEQYLQDLSAYLDIPYAVVPLELEFVAIFIRSLVFEWRLHRQSKINKASLNAIQSQCAEYSTILDLLGKIVGLTNKRDIINKIKEIFVIALGGQSFKYWDADYDDLELSEDVKFLSVDAEKSYRLKSQENRFYIKLEHNNQCFGIMEVGDFLFPQYIERYLNFGIEIGKIGGLVLTTIEQYEELVISKNKLLHISYHDSLTGLYNRSYINKFLENIKIDSNLTIFMFDIDGLKYVNDTFGHLEGDKLITGASDIIKQCFRETDIIARIGGDEFMAILPDCKTEMAESFKRRLENMISLHNQEVTDEHLKIGLSSGFAATARQIDSLESLIRQADKCMYMEKREKNYRANIKI